MKKILISGSSGFIGRKLAQKLKEKGHQIIPYDVLTGQDLLSAEQLENSIKDVDMVFHLAAQADLGLLKERPYDGVILNVGCTHNVAHFCAKYNKHLVYISTVCVYGNQKEHPTTEDSLPNPSELYACSKLAGEEIVRGYGITYGMPFTILRIPTTYGEGMRPALGVWIFFDQAMRGVPITVHGDGEQVRTLTYVDDTAEGIASVVDKPLANGEIINITQPIPISAAQMAIDIKEITGSDSEIQYVEQRPNQTFREEFDTFKAEEILGWKSKISWEEGLKKTYQWMKKTSK